MDSGDAATRRTYESIAGEYAERHADRDDVASFLDRFCAACPGERTLDVGCGPGWEVAAMAERGFDVVGVDVAREFLQMARDTAPDSEVARADMRHLPVATNSVDGVWVCASFLHVPRTAADATLAEFRRVLRPGGALFLGVVRGRGSRIPAAYDGDERRVTCYEAGPLCDRLRCAGFTVDAAEGDGMWLDVFATAEPPG